jgi:hypothetical protein
MRRWKFGDAGAGEDRRDIERQRVHCPAGSGRRLDDVVVIAVDRHAVVGIDHRVEGPDKGPDRVGGDAAPVSGMEIAVRSPGTQLDVQHAADAESDLRIAIVGDRTVGHVNEVGCEQFAVGDDGIMEVGTAGFFLALDQELDVDGERACCVHPGTDRRDVAEMLGLVVGDTTGIDATLADDRLKRRCGPQVERFRWLYVVVAVEQDRGFSRSPEPFAVDQGLATGFDDPGGEPRFLEQPLLERSAFPDADVLGADAWLGEEAEEVGERFVSLPISRVEDIG